MKNTSLTSLLTLATLFLAGTAIAQPAGSADEPGPRWKKLDLNQDGKIDETERAAAEQKMRDRLAEHPRMLARVDTDQDGEISDAEWAGAREKLKEMREHRPSRDEACGPGKAGLRDPEFRRGYLLGKYDANGDKKLDETERTALRTDMESRMRDHMEKQLTRLKAVDRDNDGKISDAEWAVAREKFKEAHPGKGPRGPGMMPPPPEPEE